MSDLPYPENPGQTHYAGCYRDRHHHNCAVVEVDRLRAENERLRRLWNASLDANRPLPFESRDTLGELVRDAWVRWAQTQQNPKPSWLLPYDDLDEYDKEADRQIGEAMARWTLIHDAAARAALAQHKEPGPVSPKD